MQPYYQTGNMFTAMLMWGIIIRKDEQKSSEIRNLDHVSVFL